MAEAANTPVMTSERIGELRAALADSFKMMKRSYFEACDPRSDSEARARANAKIDRMQKEMQEAVMEYNDALIPTRSEEYAANELLSEIKAYKDALDTQYIPLVLANDELGTSPIPSAPGAPSTSGRLLPPEPHREVGVGGEEERVGDPNRTQRHLSLSEETRSRASSATAGKRTARTGSKRSDLSERSSKATKERDEDLAREERRREEDRANNELEMEDLRRKMEEIKRREELDARLSEVKKDAIHRMHDEQQRLLEEEERAGDKPQLEFTVGGLGLGEGVAGERTRVWAEQAQPQTKQAPATSTVKKVKGKKVSMEELKETIIVPSGSEKGASPASSKSGKGRRRRTKKEEELKGNAGTKEKKEVDAGARMEKDLERLAQQQKKLLEEVEGLEKLLREKKKEVQESFQVEREEATTEKVAKEVHTAGSAQPVQSGPGGMEKFMELQARMWATTHLQEIRPKVKFAGGRRTDFSKQMKLVEGAFETPGVTARQKLQELQHYFEGPALDLVETDVLRKDAEVALEDAIGKLNRKFGVRRETALEMLEELLTGKVIGEKDHSLLLTFYAKMQSVYALAKETGRAADFEAKSVVDTILRKKLPHMMNKWFKKSVRHQREKNEDLTFSDFLRFLDEEHAVAELLAKAMQGAQAGPKTGQPPARIAATGMGKERSQGGLAKTPARECCVCGAGHAVTACSAFRSMSAADKRKQCQSGGLCFKCLERGHAARFCPEEGKCASCGQMHHTLLHALFVSSGATGPAAVGDPGPDNRA